MVDVPEGIGKPAWSPWSVLAGLARDRRMRYLVVGGVSAALYYTLFTAGWLLGRGGIPYLVVAVLANGATAALTYPLYRRGVWQATGPVLRGFLRFYAVTLWALGFTLVALPVLVEWVGLPVLLAQAIIIVANPLINYQLLRFWAFRHRKDRAPAAGDGQA